MVKESKPHERINSTPWDPQELKGKFFASTKPTNQRMKIRQKVQSLYFITVC